jgi:hypothetical protein
MFVTGWPPYRGGPGIPQRAITSSRAPFVPLRTPTWFALSEDRLLFAFAGLWTPWRGVRGPKSALIEGEHQLFGFLTTEANAVVAPIHPEAMPVILTSAVEVDAWLEADTSEALALQRPLPDGALKIVATGEKEDATIGANWSGKIDGKSGRLPVWSCLARTQSRIAAWPLVRL